MNKNLFKSESASKASLFKSSLFVNKDGKPMDEVQRKNKRKEIRNYISAVLAWYNEHNSLTPEQVKDFIDTYTASYAVNDYSVESIYNGSDDAKKAGLQKLLQAIKPKEDKKPSTKK